MQRGALVTNAEVRQFSCLSDNFGLLINDPQSGTTIAIDVPDAPAYLSVLKETGWTLSHILVTHHHWDHVQGIGALKTQTGARVVVPKQSCQKIPDHDQTVEDGDTLLAGPFQIEAIGTPGHTLDQISWYIPDLKIAHTGDTLFALGCGRIFEGDADMMWASLVKLKNKLPPETAVYCGHEYTQSNARFALTVDPENETLKARAGDVDLLRASGKPTLPTTMALELATNPFLRADEPAIKTALGLTQASAASVFAEIRRRKDNA